MPTTLDTAAVRAILEKDRVWAAFALADLTPGHRELSEWHCVPTGGQALLLIYRGFRPPLLFALGSAMDLQPLFAEISREKELRFSFQLKVHSLACQLGYRLHRETAWWRMVLDPAGFPNRCDTGVVRLGPPDEPELLRLFADGEPVGEAPDFFHPSTLGHGVYFGMREGGDLVAVAGTHVIAPEEGVAAIGNVYTRRDCRGRGLGARVTGAVAAELLRLGVKTIVLNVEARNTRAIGLYLRLGFKHHCEFREGIALRPD